MATQQRIVLVDGSSLVFRAWYALPPNLETSAGKTTNAIFGLATLFRKLFEAPDDEVDRACAIIAERMEGVVELAVPLVVDVGVGRSWVEAK